MNFPTTLERPCSALQRPWSDLGATLERPWSDRGATLERPWSDLGATSRTAAAAASATNVDKILQKVGFCVDFGRFWVDIGHPADWLFLDWDGPRSPGIPMEPDSQLNSMIGIMASKRWGWVGSPFAFLRSRPQGRSHGRTQSRTWDSPISPPLTGHDSNHRI